MKRKVVDTSLAAYKALTPEGIRAIYAKIISALKVLGGGHYEEIGNFIGVKDLNSISRRLKELRDVGILYQTDLKRPTKRGRNAYVHFLASGAKTDNELKVPKSEQKKEISVKQLELLLNIVKKHCFSLMAAIK